MYVKTNDDNTILEFPYDSGLLRRDNPQTSFPKEISDELFASYSVYPVILDSMPDFDYKTQYVNKDSTPTFNNGVWSLGWTVTDRNETQQAEYLEDVGSSMRSKRDALIFETDWWASSDLTMTAEQTAYRQALRDITSHANWPHLEDADWPTKP